MSQNKQFQTIGLIGRKGNPQVVDTLLVLADFLRVRNNVVVLENETALFLAPVLSHLPVSTKEQLGACCDLVIVVGGDGSMLGAARALSGQSVPVLGINRGSLGFLTDIAPDEIEHRVEEVLSGHYIQEERFLLEATLVRKGQCVAQACALNEVVLHRGSSLRMLEFELFLDGQFVYSQHSDGLIVSTPTGSTAYALSGGGSILHPALDAIAILPIFPHTLTSRPIVVGGNCEMRIVLNDYSGGQPELSCDGQERFSLQPGDVVEVRKKKGTLLLIHPTDHNYYETCRTKLGWGTRLV
jgi:NAD+ kinase